MSVGLTSIIIGLIIGYVAQRSRLCLVGGFRDYILVKDKYLLKGFISLLLTAIVLFFIFGAVFHSIQDYPQFYKAGNTLTVDQIYKECNCSRSAQFIAPTSGGFLVNWQAIQFNYLMLFTIIGAFLIGLLSVLGNGCPLRQHVKAASGNKSSWLYLLGFYCGIMFYQLFLSGFINQLFS